MFGCLSGLAAKTENVETCTVGKFQSLYYRSRNQSINTKTRRLFFFMFIVCIVKFQPGQNETRTSVRKVQLRGLADCEQEKWLFPSAIIDSHKCLLVMLATTIDFRGTQRQFSENICSEDYLKSRIFGTFVVKFLACLPLLGFSNI